MCVSLRLGMLVRHVYLNYDILAGWAFPRNNSFPKYFLFQICVTRLVMPTQLACPTRKEYIHAFAIPVILETETRVSVSFVINLLLGGVLCLCWRASLNHKSTFGFSNYKGENLKSCFLKKTAQDLKRVKNYLASCLQNRNVTTGAPNDFASMMKPSWHHLYGHNA